MRNISRRKVFNIGLFVALTAIIGAVFVLGFCHVDTMSGMLIASVALLFLGWLFISVLHRIVKHIWLIILMMLLLYIYGVFVYSSVVPSQNTQSGVSLLYPINNTLSIFFPSRGSYADAEEVVSSIHYHLIHILSYLFFALVGFSIFGRKLINRSGYRLIPCRYRNIFWDDSVGGMLLSQDILDKTLTQQVIFILPNSVTNDQDGEKVLFEQIDAIGAIALYRNFDTEQSLPNAYRHFFLTEDEDFNLNMALRIAYNPKRKLKSCLYVRTEREMVGQLFKDASNVEVYIFNQSDLTARKFIRDYPMLDIVPGECITDMKVNFDYRLLMLGFGATGREVMNKCICDSQFLGSSFQATVLDRQCENNYGSYEALYQESINNYNIRFENNSQICNVGSRDFYRWANENISKYNRIVIALGNDRTNLDTAMTLTRLLEIEDKDSRKLIFVQVKDSARYCYGKLPFTLFGELKEIYSYDVVIDEKMDLLAKAVNFVYAHPEIELIKDIDKRMDEASVVWSASNNIFNKDSSRAVGMNINNIIRIAGGDSAFETVINNPELIMTLAENEHLRWSAFNYTKGVRSWSEIPEKHPNDAKLFRNNDKNDLLLRHACLVSFDRLPLVAERVNFNRKLINGDKGYVQEDFQKTDLRIIRHYLLFKKLLDNEKNRV